MACINWPVGAGRNRPGTERIIAAYMNSAGNLRGEVVPVLERQEWRATRPNHSAHRTPGEAGAGREKCASAGCNHSVSI